MSDTPETDTMPERLLPSDIYRGEPTRREEVPETNWFPQRLRGEKPPEHEAEERHINPEVRRRNEAEYQSFDPKQRRQLSHERYETHQRELSQARPLEDILREEKTAAGEEVPPTVNLTLRAIEDFQRKVHDAQDFRRVVREAKDPVDKSVAALRYNQKKREVDEFKKYGPSFEAAYREYLRGRNEFVQFLLVQKRITEYNRLLSEPSFKSLPDDAPLDVGAQSRIEWAMRRADMHTYQDQAQELSDTLEALKSVYPEGTPEYAQMRETLLSGVGANRPKTKGELREELDRVSDEDDQKGLRQQEQELWQKPMVRRFWQEREFTHLLTAFAENQDVIETQSVIHVLNQLHEWELLHQRTTIGGVLVGPPGVGKTTMLRHYLEQKGRNFTYLDLSEDVTRYLLYGSKSVELSSPTEHYEQLAQQIKLMSDQDFKAFVDKNVEGLGKTASLGHEEAVAVVMDQVVESLQAGARAQGDNQQLYKDAREKLGIMATAAYHRELTTQFSHMVKRNGWRDGVIISALRRGDSIILDEFNKNKNWSLLFGLMTAKPGEKWYFGDNDEWIDIPQDWRMYFTANIGRRHGGFAIPEALASRAEGKVMEIGYPPTKEEMRTALVSLANGWGDFVRGAGDLTKLYVLMYNVFPGIRKVIEDKPQAIPISYRTIRDIGEKLIQYRDPKSGQLVYSPTHKTFDEAIYEVLVDSYKLYEDQITPREIVRLATSTGLMLDDSVKDRVIGWIGEETYNRNKESASGAAEDFKVILGKIRGLLRDVTDLPLPVAPQY